MNYFNGMQMNKPDIDKVNKVIDYSQSSLEDIEDKLVSKHNSFGVEYAIGILHLHFLSAVIFRLLSDGWTGRQLKKIINMEMKNSIKDLVDFEMEELIEKRKDKKI